MIWSIASGECLHTLVGHGDDVYAAFSPDGERVLTHCPEDWSAKIWSTASGECLHTLARHGDVIWSVAFSFEQYVSRDLAGD